MSNHLWTYIPQLGGHGVRVCVARWTMECRCGTPQCRGVVRDFHLLPSDLQLHYLSLGIVQPFIVREVLERLGWHQKFDQPK